MTDGFVVLAEFAVRPGAFDAFLETVSRNASASVRDEPGCRRFDVLYPESGGERVVLYEIYDSPAAFEAHLQTTHFAAFRRTSESQIESSDVRRFDLRENTKPR